MRRGVGIRGGLATRLIRGGGVWRGGCGLSCWRAIPTHPSVKDDNDGLGADWPERYLASEGHCPLHRPVQRYCERGSWRATQFPPAYHVLSGKETKLAGGSPPAALSREKCARRRRCLGLVGVRDASIHPATGVVELDTLRTTIRLYAQLLLCAHSPSIHHSNAFIPLELIDNRLKSGFGSRVRN